jgi:hypothetical protein
MKAISLWQPYASAIPLGLKSVETRHWQTSHRGEIAIHAAKRFGPEEKRFAMAERALDRLPARLPFGAIVAVVCLVSIRTSDELKLQVSAIERLYGNYEPGRFGWMLEEVRPLTTPVACLGRQGIFNLSPEVEQMVREQIDADPQG